MKITNKIIDTDTLVLDKTEIIVSDEICKKIVTAKLLGATCVIIPYNPEVSLEIYLEFLMNFSCILPVWLNITSTIGISNVFIRHTLDKFGGFIIDLPIPLKSKYTKVETSKFSDLLTSLGIQDHLFVYKNKMLQIITLLNNKNVVYLTNIKRLDTESVQYIREFSKHLVGRYRMVIE